MTQIVEVQSVFELSELARIGADEVRENTARVPDVAERLVGRLSAEGRHEAAIAGLIARIHSVLAVDRGEEERVVLDRLRKGHEETQRQSKRDREKKLRDADEGWAKLQEHERLCSRCERALEWSHLTVGTEDSWSTLEASLLERMCPEGAVLRAPMGFLEAHSRWANNALDEEIRTAVRGLQVNAIDKLKRVLWMGADKRERPLYDFTLADVEKAKSRAESTERAWTARREFFEAAEAEMTSSRVEVLHDLPSSTLLTLAERATEVWS